MSTSQVWILPSAPYRSARRGTEGTAALAALGANELEVAELAHKVAEGYGVVAGHVGYQQSVQ